ncbi:exported hypothetical protein [Candidatus Sulfotelmatobacter kueseliae]|uniref:Uncharacterized protein n=1 Tax=Candidatus Sulfotelmatobacter kueseliae TaxID=2042962 RepID=A0A2U3KV12_9BACT|nr:exported hypothetical protein [Candidatus Sulfotelmatobacter kueseliae]
MAWFALATAFSLHSPAQQTGQAPNPDRAGQNQQQDQPQSQPPSSTQQSPSDKDKDKDKDKAKDEKDKDKSAQDTSGQGKVAGTSNDRLFYTLPNFLTLQNKGLLPPLSTKDKYKVVALGTFDYIQYPWWGLLAAVSQADNSEPAYGQGWVSYAKRYGTQAADSTIENFMVGAVFPSILHQDPRFYYSGQGSFGRRTGYAVSRIFVTRSDSGKKQFNYSEIFGSAAAAAISTYTYHPRSTYLSTPTNPHLFVPSDRTLVNTISVWGTQVSLDTITLVVKEFWPDVHRKLSHKQRPDQGAVGRSGP